MVLIKCSECGKELSKKASVCPNCGVKIHPIKDTMKTISIVLVVFLVIILVILLITGELFNSIKDSIFDKKTNKYIGTWELVSDTNDNDILKNIEISGVRDGFHWVDIENIGYVEKDTLLARVGDGYNMACFNLEDDILIQIDCGKVEEFSTIDNIGLKYKKVK